MTPGPSRVDNGVVPDGGDKPSAPGDEAPPGKPGTGEDVCPVCKGSGRSGDEPCQNCEGTGRVICGVGSA